MNATIFVVHVQAAAVDLSYTYTCERQQAAYKKLAEICQQVCHNLRHSLASFLVRSKTDVKVVQNILRHANVKTTLGIYTHSMAEDRLAAQGEALAAILHQAASQPGETN
jgi:site-specific recombinase XerD